MIPIKCPSCGCSASVPDSAAGTKVKCRCGHAWIVENQTRGPSLAADGESLLPPELMESSRKPQRSPPSHFKTHRPKKAIAPAQSWLNVPNIIALSFLSLVALGMLKVSGVSLPFSRALSLAPGPVAVDSQEITNNEEYAQGGCKTFAEAEEYYRREDWDHDGILEYAPSMKTLFTDSSLLSASFANAEGDPGRGLPFSGYCFKVLKRQGPSAIGGARSHVVNGNMTLGYALVAYPAEYGKTGRRTFMINNNGTIYMKDFGNETNTIVWRMTEFDPDSTWVPCE